MIQLDLQKYHPHLKITQDENGRFIYDPVRKKYVKIQPEELVRQSWIQYLIQEHDIALASMAVEKQFILNNLSRRFDLVSFKKGEAHTLFEFKSFNKTIDNNTAYQAAQYNIELKVPYIVISNGVQHYAFNIDFASQKCEQIESLDFLNL